MGDNGDKNETQETARTTRMRARQKRKDDNDGTDNTVKAGSRENNIQEREARVPPEMPVPPRKRTNRKGDGNELVLAETKCGKRKSPCGERKYHFLHYGGHRVHRQSSWR